MSFLSFDQLAPFSLAGFTLNTEERTALQASLAVKKAEEKFDHVSFWGKILGVQKDYYVAQAWTDGAWFKKKNFYRCALLASYPDPLLSIDQVTWLQLPDITEDEAARLDEYAGRFVGEPGFEVVAQGEKEGEGEDAVEKPALTEEKRLTAVIKRIDYDVQIVPRGAYYRDALHNIKANKLNSGLSGNELGQLSSYLHFRPGFAVDYRLLNERAEQYQEAVDIFEPISRDDPQGVWSIQLERGGSVAILRSLLWPGYVFHHTPGQGDSPSKWGGAYYGNGQRNDNIGYML
ncbi:MAG: hypothetical protein SGCHY_004506 [Lobulomycetales sp.]